MARTLDEVYDVLVEIRDALQGEHRVTATEARTSIAAFQSASSVLGVRVTLREALAKYLKQKAHEVSPQHLDITRLTLEKFVGATWANACTPSDVTPALVAEYRDGMLEAGKSPSTANHHLTAIGGWFNWCQTMGYAALNPAAGLKLRKAKAARAQRKAFSKDEITKVFGPAFWQRTKDKPAHRWLPLIMLYTGARPEEVAQLRHRDVYDVQGEGCAPMVFDFATLEGDVRRKNEASRRLVPIHPHLIELRLCDELLDSEMDDTPLLPGLNGGHNGRLAEAPSRWFNSRWLRDECGIEDRGLVLYSLRHSVVTQLKTEHRVEESLIAQLVGHTDASMTNGRYGKEYPIEALQAVVNQLAWPVG
jgi:integrase